MDGTFQLVNSHCWVHPPDIRGSPGTVAAPYRMNDLQKFQSACQVFLARLVMVHGANAPTIQRRKAEEQDQLESDELH